MFDRLFRRDRVPTTTGNEDSTKPTPHTSANDPNFVREKPQHTNADLEAQGTHDADGWVDPYGPAPGFVGWFKLYWHDLVAFILLAAIALWLLKWSPVPYRKYFAISQDPSSTSSNTVNTDYGYPKRNQIVPIIGDAILAVFAPIVTIVITNLLGIGTYYPLGTLIPKSRRRGTLFLMRGSFWNVNNGCMGVIYSVMTGATIQIIMKLVIPGMRPHFLTVCDPQLGPDVKGSGYRGMYFDTSICRDHSNPDRQGEIANALQSFPSGHSVAAWAGLFYLSLYLNAHLKIFSNYHPSYWKLLAFVTPLVGATLIVGTLNLDMSHNWYDILAGSLIGILMAILGYRMCFASVWDFRWNHFPLRRGANRRREEVYGLGYTEQEMRDWCGGCATRRAGWGVANGRFCGAPGDSSALVHGVYPSGQREGVAFNTVSGGLNRGSGLPENGVHINGGSGAPTARLGGSSGPRV
ncbi:phosphatidic acid phosphatase type 2/haloperoxidase [Crassisporium funariophilum]|nr:phosphatidic acid phosphatase type 2/haloperoxidase [Crassisporium funariophilum]